MRARPTWNDGWFRVACLATALVVSTPLARSAPPKPPGKGAPPLPVKPAEAGPSTGRDVTFSTADKLQLAGTFTPAKTEGGAGVVLLHMVKSDRAAWNPVLKAFAARDIAVLAIDLRGHGKSALQGKKDLAPLVEKRDVALFAAMHQDAIAAVRWLVKEGKCDAKRIALVGASVGCSIAIDAAQRNPTEIAAVVCLTPGLKYLGLDTLAQLKTFPATTPLFLLSHRSEVEGGAKQIADARPGTRLLVYDEAAPAEWAADKSWAHGTNLFGRVTLVEQTVASFIAAKTASKTDDVVIDGVVEAEGANADPWDQATDVALPESIPTARAFRVGRRVVFGGTAPTGITGMRFEVQVGTEKPGGEREIAIGPPQIVGVDLKKGRAIWTWGGMGSIPNFPGLDRSEMFGKTHPVLRVVTTETGCTFEGEWIVPKLGPGDDMRLVISFAAEPPPQPEKSGAVDTEMQHAVSLPSR